MKSVLSEQIKLLSRFLAVYLACWSAFFKLTFRLSEKSFFVLFIQYLAPDLSPLRRSFDRFAA